MTWEDIDVRGQIVEAFKQRRLLLYEVSLTRAGVLPLRGDRMADLDYAALRANCDYRVNVRAVVRAVGIALSRGAEEASRQRLQQGRVVGRRLQSSGGDSGGSGDEGDGGMVMVSSEMGRGGSSMEVGETRASVVEEASGARAARGEVSLETRQDVQKQATRELWPQRVSSVQPHTGWEVMTMLEDTVAPMDVGDLHPAHKA